MCSLSSYSLLTKKEEMMPEYYKIKNGAVELAICVIHDPYSPDYKWQSS